MKQREAAAEAKAEGATSGGATVEVGSVARSVRSLDVSGQAVLFTDNPVQGNLFDAAGDLIGPRVRKKR